MNLAGFHTSDLLPPCLDSFLFDSFSLLLTQPENIFKTFYRDTTPCMIRFIPESERASSFFLERLVFSEYLFNSFIHG